MDIKKLLLAASALAFTMHASSAVAQPRNPFESESSSSFGSTTFAFESSFDEQFEGFDAIDDVTSSFGDDSYSG